MNFDADAHDFAEILSYDELMVERALADDLAAVLNRLVSGLYESVSTREADAVLARYREARR